MLGKDTRMKPGCQLWRLRKRTGRHKTFPSAEALLTACEGYFEWVEENPVIEQKAFSFQGESWNHEVPRIRAMTITGLCIHIGVARRTWTDWKRDDDFAETVEYVEGIIYEQKFAGAAAEQFSAMIISRELGLTDKSELNHISEDGSMSPKSIDAALVSALVDKLVD